MLMIQSVLVAALATFPGFVLAGPTETPRYVVHEERRSADRRWTKRARIESTAVLPMRIGLTQRSLERGDALLMDVSHPDSPRYGQYYLAEEVHDLFAPSKETISAVKDWLVASGIHKSRIAHTVGNGWLAFEASVEEAETLLLAEFYEHADAAGTNIRVGCDRYHLPEHVSPHVDFITPGVKLTQVKKATMSRNLRKPGLRASNSFTHTNTTDLPAAAKDLPVDVQACGVNMTAPCWRALYSLPERGPPGYSDIDSSPLGIFEQGDYFAKEDLDLYFEHFTDNVPNGTYPCPALIDGAQYGAPVNDTTLVMGESNADFDIAIALLFPREITVYQTDDQIYSLEEVAARNTFNTFLDALDGSYCNYTTGDDPDIDPVYPNPAEGGYKGERQCGVFTPTPVISVSYGESEIDLPFNYTQRQCYEFMKLGMQGISVLFASGDYGVASFPSDDSESGCLGPDQTIFNPQYPNNCPYVIGVGGTMLNASQTVKDPESVMAVDLGGTAVNFSSAGGFSNYFPRPEYQRSAVQTYLDKYAPDYPSYEGFAPDLDLSTVKGLYNRAGRAFPDVAANGAYMPTYVNGQQFHFFGSSLAAPLFSTVLVLLNEDRAALGKSNVGFILPVLYEHPEVLNDIVDGHNFGCGTQGFAAAPGWDPVTGLGTPNYPAMKKLYTSLP